MSYSSLCVLRNPPKRFSEEQYTSWGEMAGLKFIKLRHHYGPVKGEQSIRGFQCAFVTKREAENGSIKYDYQLSNIDGVACAGGRGLVFREDPIDSMLYAYLPDTPFNRKTLATTYFPGASWDICDEKIAAEARALYEQIKDAEKLEKTKDEVIVDTAAELEEKNEEIERLKAELAKAKKIDETVKAASKRPATKAKSLVQSVVRTSAEVNQEIKSDERTGVSDNNPG